MRVCLRLAFPHTHTLEDSRLYLSLPLDARWVGVLRVCDRCTRSFDVRRDGLSTDE